MISRVCRKKRAKYLSQMMTRRAKTENEQKEIVLEVNFFRNCKSEE